MVQLQARDVKSAEASLRRAIELDPSLAAAHTALGVVLATTGRKAEAIAAWQKAAALGDPNAADNLRAIR
jgi:Flp pilus assembly protein TadD